MAFIRKDLHPDTNHGGRKFVTHEKFLLTPTDATAIETGKLYRLMDCLNFRKEGKGFTFDSQSVDAYRKNGEKIMHWLPAEKKGELVKIEMVMPDNSRAYGLAETTVKQVKVGEVVQFERFGFARCDTIEKDKMVFWYSHR